MTALRRGTHGLLAVIAGALLALAPASPAAAHAALLRTSPEQGAVAETPPERVTLTFSEPVQPVAEQVRIVGPNGARADWGEARASGAKLMIPLRSGAPRGTYLVSYRVISADGHPVAGGFSFSVGERSATPAVEDEQGGYDPVVVSLLTLSRYAGYAGLVALVGGLGVLLLAWPARLPRRGPARLAWCGAGLVGAGAVGEILLQGAYVKGGGLAELRGADVLSVITSQYGYAHLARLALLLAAVPVIRRLGDGPGARLDRVLLPLIGGAALVTWPLSGHPAASPIPWLSVLTDVAHLGAMSVWLGGLTVLLGFLLRARYRAGLTEVLPLWLRAWSRLAMTAVGVLVLAGVTQAVIEIASWDALVNTRYGVLVLVKAGILAVIVAAAALARQLVARLASVGTEDGGVEAGEAETAGETGPETSAERTGGALRRLVAVELTLAAAVLAVTAVLAQTTPGRTDAAAAAAAQPQGPQSLKLTSKLYTLRVEIDPGRVGENQIHLYAATPDGKPLKVLEWKVTAALPSAKIAPVEVPVAPVTDDHATGQAGLPTAGRWVFRFTLRISEIDQATVKATAPIR